MNKRFDLTQSPINPGVTLIEASAGTGKTYCLSNLVLRTLLEGRIKDISRVLVVTFTNPATDELKLRIRDRIREALDYFSTGKHSDDLLKTICDCAGKNVLKRLTRALSDFDKASISTIHGFCKKILAESAFESGMPFETKFSDNLDNLITQAAQDFWRKYFYESNLLSSLSTLNGWSAAGFIREYKDLNRYPNTTISPPSTELSAVLSATEESLKQARRNFNENELRAFLSEVSACGGFSTSQNKKISELRQLLNDNIKSVFKIFSTDNPNQATLISVINKLTSDSISKVLLKTKTKDLPLPSFIESFDHFFAKISELEHAIRCEFFTYVRKSFEAEKERLGIMSFDDLLSALHRAVTDRNSASTVAEAIRSRFDAAMIDEFQDTDSLQCEIFLRAFAGSNVPLYFIGDPKQAIYSFRGADIFAYMSAKKEADSSYTLGTNWRSESAVVHSINALFSIHTHPFIYKPIPFDPVDSAGKADAEPLHNDGKKALEWWFIPPGDETGKSGRHKGRQKTISKESATPLIYAAIAEETLSLITSNARIGQRKIEPSDIAVLVRSNRQAGFVRDALAARGIPAVLSQSGSILDSSELAELRTLLTAIADPGNPQAARALMSTIMWGANANEIDSFNNDENSWQRLAEKLRRYHKIWNARGLMPAINSFLAEHMITEHLLSLPDGPRRMTNLRHATEVIQCVSQERKLCMEGLLRWLQNPEDISADMNELRLETDAHAVQVVTIHKSKGLEYNIVFCPFLWEAKTIKPNDLPIISHTDVNGVTLEFGKDNAGKAAMRADEERLAEDIRLAYVALTRAKHRNYAVWGGISDSGYSALAHLLFGETSTPSTTAEWRKPLEQLAASAPDFISVNELPEMKLSKTTLQIEMPEKHLSMRTFPAGRELQFTPWQMTSYSRFARGSSGETPDYHDPSTHETEEKNEPKGILAFGRGPDARGRAGMIGTCLHSILEYADFSEPDSKKNETIIRELLNQYGLNKPQMHAAPFEAQDVVMQTLSNICNAKIAQTEFSLKNTSTQNRITEWQFYLPMKNFSPASLAGIFHRHATGYLKNEYPKHLAQLDRSTFAGYLTGFVDLIFEHYGKWHILDWKSNYLGASQKDYSLEKIQQSMIEHHYPLQYHLYTVALQRYLRQTIPDYNYQVHFGGAIYAYIRGIDANDEHGWHFDLPPQKLIDTLDLALRGDNA